MSNLPDDLKLEVRQYLERQVRSGFADLEALPRNAGEYLSDDGEPAVIEAFARTTLQEILTEYRAEQLRWPSTTDCDRLDAAFMELESSGIVARQNFWCCGTCGLAAIGDEIEEYRAGGNDVRGYTFYHEQDTQAAVDGQGLYLYYGAADDTEAHALEIAREIQAVLKRHGLSTQWDGTFKNRIELAIVWKRRQP